MNDGGDYKCVNLSALSLCKPSQINWTREQHQQCIVNKITWHWDLLFRLPDDTILTLEFWEWSLNMFVKHTGKIPGVKVVITLVLDYESNHNVRGNLLTF